jgi:transposase
METATTQGQSYHTTGATLYMAMEISEGKWKLGLSTGAGQKGRERNVRAGDLEGLKREIVSGRRRFGLPEGCRVLSCYEAGRVGFWLHRFLESVGVVSLVVDAASIDVSRRARRAKTDRLDVHKLLAKLMRYDGGERKAWSVVRVPTIEQEDARHLHRGLLALKKDRTRVVNRIKGLLATQGVRLTGVQVVGLRLEGLKMWDGSALGPGLRARIGWEQQRLVQIEQQIRELQAERRRVLRTGRGQLAVEQIHQLMKLRAVGPNSAWVFVHELFSWRDLRNRRQLGALAGLTPTPHASGASYRDLGISKAGNPQVRMMIVEIAWAWLRFQPHSELSQWYRRRFGTGSKRLRRIGIVALGRKLLIALWRYLDSGEVPAGATLKV